MGMKDFCFDLYGTLLDIRTDEESEAFWTKISELLKEEQNGEELKLRYRFLCERERDRQGKQEFDLLPVFGRLSEKNIGDPSAFAYAFRKASVIKCRPFEGIPEMLAELKIRGANLYLLSNAQACFTRAELEESGLAQYFNGIMLSSEIGWKKPDVRFFECAISRFGLNPGNTVYAGNDLHDDVGGAKGAGMTTVYMQTEQSGKYRNPPVPDYEVLNVKELSRTLFRFCGEGER